MSMASRSARVAELLESAEYVLSPFQKRVFVIFLAAAVVLCRFCGKPNQEEGFETWTLSVISGFYSEDRKSFVSINFV